MFKNVKIDPLNVGSLMYNNPMKKRTKPLGKANEARRKAESKALFQAMLLTKAGVVIPDHHKGTRQSNKRKAIAEQM